MSTLSETIDSALRAAAEAHLRFSQTSVQQRAELMHAIAAALEKNSDELIAAAAKETHLDAQRLLQELLRTSVQWQQYGDACEKGYWMHVIIDTALPEKNRPDIRKYNRALGPVVVFGASNFPFAYSTPGGDVASAIAAGCPVVVKAHPAHPQTSELTASIIRNCIAEKGFGEGVFSHITDSSFESGQLLVKHPLTAAVAFTGSLSGGKALYDLAAARPNPIPVFAEMGSVNPVFILPGAVSTRGDEIADKLVDSLTASAGQFCTNPGVWIMEDSAEITPFLEKLQQNISNRPVQEMLHPGIARQFHSRREEVLAAQGVSLLGATAEQQKEGFSLPTIAVTTAEAFRAAPTVQHEVFGPFAVLVKCRNQAELLSLAQNLEGQLTGTIWGNDSDISAINQLREILTEKCGRIIFNGVPTGVTVTQAMQHGGPFPGTTDTRFTAVGADAILRFIRPVCYQNWPDELLPLPLRNRNPSGIPRFINGELTKADLSL